MANVMMATRKTVVVKLGGSIVSDKTVDFSYREEEIIGLARAIAVSGRRVVLVHGGGAFGHPMARRYGLSSSMLKKSAEGVSETRGAMFDLNLRICDALSTAGLRPYTVSPFTLLSLAGSRGASWLNHLLDSGLTPITFGDVVYDDRAPAGGGFRIISGDTISRVLSRSLRASRCIFVMDVDGVLDGSGKVIPELTAESLRTTRTMKSRRRRRRSSSSGGGVELVEAAKGTSQSAAPPEDATGGIVLKLKEAMKIAQGGTEVAFVSGFRKDEFAKALKRKRFHGTIVRVPPRD